MQHRNFDLPIVHFFFSLHKKNLRFKLIEKFNSINNYCFGHPYYSFKIHYNNYLNKHSASYKQYHKNPFSPTIFIYTYIKLADKKLSWSFMLHKARSYIISHSRNNDYKSLSFNQERNII